MMEEVSDDTNGESTFEFVSGKVDESLKGDSAQSTAVAEDYSLPLNTGAQQTNVSHMPGSSQPPFSPTIATDVSSHLTNIAFYDPNQHATSQHVLPPLAVPPTVNPHSPSSISTTVAQPYIPMQQSYPPATFPQNAQSPLSVTEGPTQSNVPHSSLALSLPLDAGTDTFQPANTESGVWGWIKGKEFLNKVAEKAKSSVDSVITTLDPGMKEIINSGGDINVIVASSNEMEISALREAFQQVFGKATVQGIPVQSCSIAAQPVGFSAGLKAAEERISYLKQHVFVDGHQILVAVENFLVELTPDNWFDIGCLLLQDWSAGITLQVYTQAVPISSHFVSQAKERTPPDYSLGWSGFAVTIGQLAAPAFGVHHSEWHQALSGVSRREMLFISAKTLAGLYKNQQRHQL